MRIDSSEKLFLQISLAVEAAKVGVYLIMLNLVGKHVNIGLELGNLICRSYSSILN